MSQPPNARFLGFPDKDASDEEIAEWLQHAIAEIEKAKVGAEGLEPVPPGAGREADAKMPAGSGLRTSTRSGGFSPR